MDKLTLEDVTAVAIHDAVLMYRHSVMILTRAQADLFLTGPPARWPLDQPWPPRVTVPAAPCWACVTMAR